MQYHPLTALSPLDGRYAKAVAPLAPFLSEYALIRYRIRVEAEYLIALCEAGISPLPRLSDAEKATLRRQYLDFSIAQAERVKEIEATTNHDVKAVEYFMKDRLQSDGPASLLPYTEFIHFGLTSQDINNTAIPLMLGDALREAYIPALREVTGTLRQMSHDWASIPLLARTHGQPASPTTMGKEMAVFVSRLQALADELASLPLPAKFGGATGNLNAHYAAYPQVNWSDFANQFVTGLGLTRSYPTTQIEHYDGLARVFDAIRRINVVLQDLCQDMWLYVSRDIFRQKVKAGEVGSSAMPHKVNPIDFENAEGNCGLSTALLEFLSRKLPVSRLQRDLTDSTVLRNIGPALGYALLAVSSVKKGLGKLLLNEALLRAELDTQWAVLAEPIQTILRREGYPQPYEALKALTRGNEGITAASIREFILSLEVNEQVRAELLALRPDTYTGDAESAAHGV